MSDFAIAPELEFIVDKEYGTEFINDKVKG
jgi:hypothetical protein